MEGWHQYCGEITNYFRNITRFHLRLFTNLSVETFTYVHSAVGQQLSVDDMGAQVKDLIVLVELFTYSFLFHFRNSAKCAGDSHCYFCFIWGPKGSG